MNDDVRRQLEAAGRRPVPGLRPEFEAGLEERLLAIARTPAPATPPERSPRRPTFRLGVGLAALVVVLGFVAVLAGGDPTASPDLRLTGSVNVEVALADGTTLLNPDGLLLPDGAIVRVGAGGSARVGEVVLAAGDVATVVDRRLRVDREPPSQAARPGERTPPASASPPIDPPTRTSPAATPAPGRTTPPPSDRPATPAPARTAAPVASPSRTTPPATATPVRSPTAPPQDDVRPLQLKARAAGPAEVGASWTGSPRAVRYVLVASSSRLGPAPDPTYPGSTIIGTFSDPPATPLIFRVREGVAELRLLVVALGADGTELTRSTIVTVTWSG